MLVLCPERSSPNGLNEWDIKNNTNSSARITYEYNCVAATSYGIMRDSIFATLIYYDILDFPLTLFEIKKYLINPERDCEGSSRTKQDAEQVRGFVRDSQRASVSYGINPARFMVLPQPVGEISLGDIQKELEDLLNGNKIGQKNGLWFLKGRDILYEKRMEKDKIAAAKWKKFLRIAKWFAAVPYLRGIMAGGSLSYNNATENSDFDVLVIAKSGRLYTCRVFLSFVASFFRARRKRFDLVAPDKFCFNHYLTDGNLNIKHESLYNAQSYANLKPVLTGEELFKKFFGANAWINKYVYNFRPVDDFVLRKIKPSPVLVCFSKIAEKALNPFLGNWLERFLKYFQQKRIKNNPATYESGGRVVFNDSELEFHPRSFEKVLIEKYNAGLKKTGIIAQEEKDSGLYTY